MPFGARLRYVVFASHPERAVVGCLQFSSPAWRMAARDRWIGWDDTTRANNLQHVVNNSRFLLLPWVELRNLASAVLARGLAQLVVDWPHHYGIEPALVETLVDSRRYHGGCYRAANWIALGQTSGRGRMDRHRRRDGAAPKTIFVYPLVAHRQPVADLRIEPVAVGDAAVRHPRRKAQRRRRRRVVAHRDRHAPLAEPLGLVHQQHPHPQVHGQPGRGVRRDTTKVRLWG